MNLLRDRCCMVLSVLGIPDVLSWIDRHLDIHLDRCSVTSPHPGGLPRLEQPSLFRLPFYDRILFIGLGGLADCETGENGRGGGGSSLDALTSTLYAAVTDLFLYKAVKQQALDEFRRRKRREELRKRHSLHHGGDFTSSSSSRLYSNRGQGQGDDHRYSSSSGVVTPEDEATVLRLESRIRSKIKIAVLDSRRPLHGALMTRVCVEFYVSMSSRICLCRLREKARGTLALDVHEACLYELQAIYEWMSLCWFVTIAFASLSSCFLLRCLGELRSLHIFCPSSSLHNSCRTTVVTYMASLSPPSDSWLANYNLYVYIYVRTVHVFEAN